MISLPPLQCLFEERRGEPVPMPPALAALYGELCFPHHAPRPYVIANFVTTLDGVVSLGLPGQSGGGEISGNNPHDRLVMGILRAVADAVVVGAGTLRAVPRHRWTAEYIFPEMAEEYRALRAHLGLAAAPTTVIVTAHGELDLSLPVFQGGESPVLIVTTERGAEALRANPLPPSVEIAAIRSGSMVSARELLETIPTRPLGGLILVEGGPVLLGAFFAERCLDELFLTLAPQIAGRENDLYRPGLIAGRSFAPADPRWGHLVSVKLAGSHLFLRYAWETAA